MNETLTTKTLYLEHWQYVFQVLPSYGVPTGAGSDVAKDVAQTVWTTVHVRLASYDPALHKSPRAWLTGIVRRCAADYRRTLRRRWEVAVEEPGDRVAAPGLDPEQAALLGSLRQAVRNDDQYEAFVLRHLYGHSIEEIAASTGATESAVEWRISMAKKALGADGDGDNDRKARAYLGFGSLEALVEALRPKPIPPEHGAALWKRIAEHIGEGTAIPVPAIVARAPAGMLIAKTTLAGLLLGAFFAGAAAGVGGMLLLQAYKEQRAPVAREVQTAILSPVAAATPLGMSATSPSSPPEALPAPPVAAAPLGAAATSPSRLPEEAPPASPVATAPHSSAAREKVASSQRLLLQMRRAAAGENFQVVLALARQHAQRFPDLDAEERETERSRALTHLARRTGTNPPFSQ